MDETTVFNINLTIGNNASLVAMETSTELSDNSSFIPSLEDLEWNKYIQEKIPVVVYLAVLSIVGVIGNAHALVVYSIRYKSSNHRTFVVWLAAVDIMACALSIPFEIIDTRYSYTFSSVAACKLFRFLNHFVSLCSGFLLGVIATERFQKACRPMGRQLSHKQAQIACVVTTVTSLVLAVPGLVFYAPAWKTIDGYNLEGQDCTVATAFKGKIVFKAYSFVLLLLCTIVFILCIVTYSFIGKVLYRQMQFRRASQTKSPKQRIDSLSSAKDAGRPLSSSDGNGNMLQKEPQSPGIAEEESSVGEFRKTSVVRSNSRIRFIHGKKFRIFDRSKQITLMFLVATAVSYIGYLPHLILVIIQAVNKHAYEDIKDALGPGSSILIRGYFISNVTNPLVYCFLDDRFRTECKKMYCKLKVVIVNKARSIRM